MSFFHELDDAAKKQLWAGLALRHAEGIGARSGKRLVEKFGSPLTAVEAGLATPEAWKSLVPTAVSRAFAAGRWRLDAGREWDALRTSNEAFLCWTDAQYPDLLRELPDAPLLFYYKGDISLLRGPSIAIVGARNCTREGMEVSIFFAHGLTRAGVSIISGMARGIDRAAHLAGLEGPGRSIAVMGTGIDEIYPPCNADLYARLAEKGLLISEFAPGTLAAASRFPVRNRLISGLSQGVLVVEATGKSGSLITARLALEQNRDVFAVPGHTLAAVSEGCRELIRRGAKPVFSAEDILQDLAPLLSLEVLKLLERRHAETSSDQVTPEPRRADCCKKELDVPRAAKNSQNGVPVLEAPVQGSLPWGAPDIGAKRRVRTRELSVASTDFLSLPERKKALASQGAVALTAEESTVFAALCHEPRHIDDLSRILDMDVAKLSGLLALFEIRGLARRAPGMWYSRREA